MAKLSYAKVHNAQLNKHNTGKIEIQNVVIKKKFLELEERSSLQNTLFWPALLQVFFLTTQLCVWQFKKSNNL